MAEANQWSTKAYFIYCTNNVFFICRARSTKLCGCGKFKSDPPLFRASISLLFLYTYFIKARTERRRKKASIYDDLFFSRRTQVTYVMYMEKRRIIAALISSTDKRCVAVGYYKQKYRSKVTHLAYINHC